jgi:hypothetical protein
MYGENEISMAEFCMRVPCNVLRAEAAARMSK